jgi:hypothetical protein
MNDYYLLMNGSKIGPMTADTINEWLAKGKINANQMVSVDNGDWLRLFEMDGFGHLAPAKVEDKKLFVELDQNLGIQKFILAISNLVLLGALFIFGFRHFSIAMLGVWAQLLLVAVYTIILSELITNKAVKKQVDIVAYILMFVMWGSVVMGILA